MVRLAATLAALAALAHLAGAAWTVTWYDSSKNPLDSESGSGSRGDGHYDTSDPDPVPINAKHFRFRATSYEVFYMSAANGEESGHFQSSRDKHRITPRHKSWSIQGHE